MQRQEPMRALRPAALLVDATHGPSAAVDGEVLPILVDPGAKSGWAELEGHLFMLARSKLGCVMR
jgi:hypothetical protein